MDKNHTINKTELEAALKSVSTCRNYHNALLNKLSFHKYHLVGINIRGIFSVTVSGTCKFVDNAHINILCY